MNTGKRHSVFGIYQNHLSVDNGVTALQKSGFSSDAVSMLLPTEGSTNFVHEKSSKAPEGAATGITGGAALGGGLGWLIGIGSLAIPGVGPFIAAGPIMAALAGATIGGAVGGITGALIGMGIPEYEAKRYESFVKDGGILLSVHVEDDEQLHRAEEILKITGAKDVATTNEDRLPKNHSGFDHHVPL